MKSDPARMLWKMESSWRRIVSGGSELRAHELRQDGCSRRGIHFAKRLQDTGKGFKRLGSALVFRTVRKLACDCGRPQVSFGAVVGWLDTMLAEKTQQVAAIMLGTGSVEKPLIIRITEAAFPKLNREFF